MIDGAPLAIAGKLKIAKSEINISRQTKGVHRIGSRPDVVVVLVVQFEVEMLVERKICTCLKRRFVPALRAAAVEKLTLHIRRKNEAVNFEGSLHCDAISITPGEIAALNESQVDPIAIVRLNPQRQWKIEAWGLEPQTSTVSKLRDYVRPTTWKVLWVA